MTFFQSLVLGVVQGLTEFLPVSSSGHLVVMGAVLGVPTPPLIYDLLLHLATTMAAIIFFWKQLRQLNLRQILIIISASVPVGIVGVLFKDKIAGLFGSLLLVSIALLITGILNILSDRVLERQKKFAAKGENHIKNENEGVEFPSFKQGLLVGVFQMMALTPGISRSGSTVFAGLLSGLKREAAFNFSFLLVIPPILIATFLEIQDVVWTPELVNSLPVYSVGIVTSFFIGLFSLWLLKKILVSSKWDYFGFYCLFLGGGLIVAQIFGLF